QLNFPVDVAVDSFGNLFIGDGANHRVRKVNSAGVITTIAGNGGSGFAGDGGPAMSAQISIGDVEVDAVGNVFIVDVNRVRKIDSTGVINTVAGNGTAGFSGDG